MATPEHRHILVIGDEPLERDLDAALQAEAFDVHTASEAATAIAIARATALDVAILNMRLLDTHAMSVLQALTSHVPSLPVIVLGTADPRTIVQVMLLGAADVLPPPFSLAEVLASVRRAIAVRAFAGRSGEPLRGLGARAVNTLAAQMGPSAAVAAIAQQVKAVAASDFTVLISGETGTGKELVAQSIHGASDRRARPFVALDCGAIPESLLESELFGHERGAFTGADRRKIGRFRLAENGTCFLDEAGNLPLFMQVKLLRVLESREVQPIGADRATPMNVRFIAATNVDVQSAVVKGTFRRDLYFRLSEYTISLPPLRTRPEDIEYLTRRFMEEVGIELRRPVLHVEQEALDLLGRHGWPGNVRELRNVVRQAVLRSQTPILSADSVHAVLEGGHAVHEPLLSALTRGQSLKQIAQQAMWAAERAAITEALAQAHGNKAAAARLLRTDYKTLYLKLRRMSEPPARPN
ncbi:MAG: sigma-54 dependent transcriptional regulator [Vicinamibacterales bacterium]